MAGMVPRMIGSGAQRAAGRSPLAQLLHALNQPLTGLQCSMEVALAVPRTPEQYIRGLREGLELTERMRALVEAIREVADGEEERKEQHRENDNPDMTELKSVLQTILDDLAPVAEARSIRVTCEDSAGLSRVVRMGQQRAEVTMFRLLEAVMSLAVRESVVGIEMGGISGAAWIRVGWRPATATSAFSQPELGLLIAQASFERAGAAWERERRETLETVTIHLPGVSGL